MARSTTKSTAKSTAKSTTTRRKRVSSNVPQQALASISLTLTDLPEKPKDSWSLREAVEQLQDSITIAMQRGYSYDDIVKVLASSGIHITASSLKRYLSIAKRATSTAKPRRTPQPTRSQPAETFAEEPVLEMVSPPRRRGRTASEIKTAAKAKATPRTTAARKRTQSLS